jgi:hypothetical protein
MNAKPGVVGTPEISALRKMKHDDREFKENLDYTTKFSQNQNKQTKNPKDKYPNQMKTDQNKQTKTQLVTLGSRVH